MDFISEFSMLINFICNIILSLAFTLFIIFVFGRPDSAVHKFSIIHGFLLKFGLAFCTIGALLNALTFSDPPISELILNIGLAVLFTWASIFHYKKFVIKKEIKVQHKTAKKTIKKVSKKKRA